MDIPKPCPEESDTVLADALLFAMEEAPDQTGTTFAVPVPVTVPVVGVVHARVARVPETDETVSTWVALPIVPGRMFVYDVTEDGAANETLVVGSVVAGVPD
jgi:hypothetical protein